MTTFVQLGRYGDIINLLPLCHRLSSNQDVKMIVNNEFLPLFDGISYVSPIATSFRPEELEVCIEKASKEYDNVIATQVFKNPRPATENNFCLQQWAYAGKEYLPLYHYSPLIFGRRDKLREDELVRRFISKDKPNVLVNLTGISSPFADNKGLKSKLRLNDWNVIDVGTIVASRIYDLLGLYEQSDFLVTTDTSTLHLGYATKIPTVCLSLDIPFLQSEPRSHWIARQTYGNYQPDDIIEMVRSSI